jgi:molybdopterin adenylyltransferase
VTNDGDEIRVTAGSSKSYRHAYLVTISRHFSLIYFHGMISAPEELIVGLVSISDRASQGVYQDEGLPALEEWLGQAVAAPPVRVVKRLIPDERPVIEAALKELVDREGCHLVLTTGGTGPAPRDVTPEATLAVADRVMPGFGEQMRQVSLRFVPTAILSRQVGVIRKQALILNLPGQPKAIRETLEGVKDETGRTVVNGIFAAVPYCVDLIGGPYIETREGVVKAFRPKSAIRPRKS